MQKVSSGYGLVEGPTWDPATGLYFSDVLNGGVYRLSLSGEVSLVVPKRRGVGGIALHEDGGLIVGGRNIAWVSADGTQTDVLLGPGAIPGAIGFNDLTTDRQGRIYVGSLTWRVFADEPKPGYLHVIESAGACRTLSDGVMLTNGLGFSPGGERLYHSDSRSGLVRVYEVGSGGEVGAWRAFATMASGVPDGLKVAADGSVWVADARGGRVAVFEPDGAHRMDLAVPAPMVTSLCFGGDDLRDLYVVTGSQGGPSENCAAVFHTRVEVAGLPLSPARVSH